MVVVHVGGVYGDRAAALERWARAYEALSEQARARVVVEHDETSFSLHDVLELHRQTGVRVMYDHHHHRCNPAPELRDHAEAIEAALATWPAEQRPKVHLSSPRTELRTVGKGKDARLVPPLVDQHADFVTPWDLLDVVRVAGRPVDVMIEAKAKDVALLWLREQLKRIAPEAAAAEERAAQARRPRAAPKTA